MNLISPFNKGEQKITRRMLTCISISGWATEQIYFKHSMTCNCLKKGPILDATAQGAKVWANTCNKGMHESHFSTVGCWPKVQNGSKALLIKERIDLNIYQAQHFPNNHSHASVDKLKASMLLIQQTLAYWIKQDHFISYFHSP